MSGDIQTRQRRKEKRKQKRDEPAIGVDTANISENEKKNVQMHISSDHTEHGVGWCAKIVFFLLMAILTGLVALIVIENRGGSDLDTPLSESRFSEYLQGWVDENRPEETHDEPHFSHEVDDEHETINDVSDEPYPDEKDNSNSDNEVSEELDAEAQMFESEDLSLNQEPDSEEAGDTASVEKEADEDSAPFEEEEDNDADLENVFDNDEGEDLLLKKLSEQTQATAQQQEHFEDEEEEESSSLNSLGVKLGVGVILAIVAHQIIIKNISATNRLEKVPDMNEEFLSKRRLTILTATDENLIDEDLDDEEIIEVMMVSRAQINGSEVTYSNSDTCDEEEEYGDEIVQTTNNEYVPKIYEDFQTMFKNRLDTSEPQLPQSLEPQSVDIEMEKRVEQELSRNPEGRMLSDSSEPEGGEEESFEEELSNEELSYEDEEEEEEDIESENLSEIDDTELMTRLEAKYGKISGDDEDDDQSWTKVSQESGAQSYLEEYQEA